MNTEWSYTTGEPDSLIDWSASAVRDERLVVVGNTQTPTQAANVLISAYEEGSGLLWEEEYSSAGGINDFGVDVVLDGDYNVYLCAASYSGSGGTSDYLVLKYGSDGNFIWDYTFNGAGNHDDIPASLVLDPSGNVYITGISTDSGGDFDFATVKLDNDGNHEWTRTYDRSGYDDIAVKIVYQSGELTVAGGSGESTTDWDYLVLQYDTDGALLEEETIINPGFGFDKPADMAVDDLGNIYITGSISQNGTDYDIYTVMLDEDLSVVWDERYGNNNFQDGGLSVAVDPQGNVYVGGFTGTAVNKQFTLLSYDDTGDLNWERVLYPDTSSSGIAKKIAWHPAGYLIASGEYTRDSTSTTEIVTVACNADGSIKWQKNYEQANLLPETPHQMSINEEGVIFVSGITIDGQNTKYLTLSYAAYEFARDFAFDSTSAPSHIEDQVIISFAPDALIEDDFETTKIEWGELSRFVKGSVITAIEGKIGQSDIGEWKAYKVHRKLTIGDSISTTRLGRQEKLLPLWTTMVLETAEPPNTFVLGYEQDIADSLNTLAAHVRFAHLNFAVTADSNDPLYTTGMASLHPTLTYPNAHINVENAWDIETGKDHVKVGVYDSGIRWSHEDFGDGTFAGSRVKGGWDWLGNQPIDNDPDHDAYGHGTAVAGVVGAIRNNTLGIAGIAGGDASQGISGVQLYAMKMIGMDGVLGDAATVAGAIVEGAIETTGNGYGLHIMNMSWGYETATEFGAGREAIYTAWRNDVAMFASRGNLGSAIPRYPATSRDGWLVSVGGTGNDGQYLTNANGGVSSSSYGLDMDLCAPGAVGLIATTGHVGNSDYLSIFSETSAATPHVAGVAALMLSHVNVSGANSPDNLAPEDVEFILQKYANDRVLYGVGYDDSTGWGLLDAGASLQAIEQPANKILHFNTESTSSDITQVGTNTQVFLSSGTLNNGLAAAVYLCDVYKVEVTHSHSIGANYSLIDYWPRNNASDLIGPDAVPEQNIGISQCDETEATLVGYAFFVKYNLFSQAINRWVPFDPFSQSANFAYSLHVHNGSVKIDPKWESQLQAQVIPNPSAGAFTVVYEVSKPADSWLEIFDLSGKQIYVSEIQSHRKGNLSISFDLSSYPQGIYIGKLHVGELVQPLKMYRN